MRFTAAGDAIIQRRIQNEFQGFKELAPFINRGDAKFFNLETTLNYEGECFASQFSGGTYIRTNPEVLEDLKKFGFNLTTFNNNHALDFSYGGFIKTLEHLNKSGLVHSGTGMNLDEAASPRYIETANGRVALIAVNTSFNPSMLAGKQSRKYPGRPGINGLRIEEEFVLTSAELEAIKSIAKRTNINAQNEIIRNEGYLPVLPENQTEFGNYRFTLGDTTELKLSINKQDFERVEKAIYEASLVSDYIIISVHTHQLVGESKETVPEYLKEFCHNCIDMGANAIIGHGPHLLRAIEVYKDSPIFYSLGDFILQLYNIESAPEDFYNKYGLTSESTIHELLKKRSKDFSIGLMEDIKMFESVIPYWETKDKKLTKLELLPIVSAMKGKNSEIGLPRKAENLEFIDRLAKMSADNGLKFNINKDKTIEIKW